MPITQNGNKFLKRRKYYDSNSERFSAKLSFDLETKKVFQSKEEDFSHLVSKGNKLSPLLKQHKKSKSMTDLTSSIESEKSERGEKNDGSWKFFSFEDVQECIVQSEKFSVMLNGETMDDFGQFESYSDQWKYQMTDAAFEQVCSIQCYQF